jgi:putative restriction endonuclease
LTLNLEPFVANTDQRWFEFLRSASVGGVVDEVNFWSPMAQRPMRQMQPGEPMFFRLKRPRYAVAGYGFFAHFALLELDVAWETFGTSNGFSDRIRFLEALGGWRQQEVPELRSDGRRLACTILRDAVFWPEDRWIPWGSERGWPPNVTQGMTIRDAALADLLLRQIQLDQHVPPEEFMPEFTLVDADEREIVSAQTRRRVGQGAFRTRLLTAYGARCAITGERTEPVLDAAHVQPYLGPRSNHIQNGLLLTKEFHALFDHGLVTVTPEHVVRVSPRIRDRWSNGKRYYDFHDRKLAVVPADARDQPSSDALHWHNLKRFAS